MPPEYLMQQAKPLPKTKVPTTRHLMDRLVTAERSYEEVAAQLNTLIAWLRATAP